MDRPQETKDVRWADYLNFFPYAFTVTPTCLPLASIHLPDTIGGQLLARATGGHIHL
jgi:hypothetical protein